MKKTLLILAFMSFMNTKCTPSTEDCSRFINRILGYLLKPELDKNSNLKNALENCGKNGPCKEWSTGSNQLSTQVHTFCNNFYQKYSDLLLIGKRPEHTTLRYCICMLSPGRRFLKGSSCLRWAQ